MSSKSGIRKKTKDCGRLKPAKPASAMSWISREETSNTSQKGEGSAQTSNSGKQMGKAKVPYREVMMQWRVHLVRAMNVVMP